MNRPLTSECDLILNDPQYLRTRVDAVLNEYPELTYYGLGYPNAADDGSYLHIAPHQLTTEQLELYDLARARLCEGNYILDSRAMQVLSLSHPAVLLVESA